VRRTDDEWGAAERIRDADTHLASTNTRVNDLAYRLITVLRRNSWQMSGMTDCPGLYPVAWFIIVGRSVGNGSEQNYRRRCGAEEHSAIDR